MCFSLCTDVVFKCLCVCLALTIYITSLHCIHLKPQETYQVYTVFLTSLHANINTGCCFDCCWNSEDIVFVILMEFFLALKP